MNSKSMAGWIGFAGILMLIIGSIDFFQGLIALIEDEYYVVTASGFLVVDLTGWGWIMMIWGVLLVLAGLGLLSAQGWARWFAIVVVSLNFIAQLGFLGNSQYPLWSLTVMALNIIVLYALTARWSESAAELSRRPHLAGSPGSRPSRDIPARRPRRSRRRTPCSPGRAQGRGVRRLVRVLLLYRGQLEARVLERGTDVRIRVEVLPVLLAEGVPVTGPRELDPGIAGAGAGIDDTTDHEVVSRRLTRDHRVGDGEVHHRVGVQVEDEPTGGPKASRPPRPASAAARPG